MASYLHRRSFLRAAGSGLAFALGGCNDPTVRAILLGLKDKTPQAFRSPDGNSVDLITHTLSRLTWGAGPGDYERVASLHANPDRAVALFLEQQLAPESPTQDRSEAALRVRRLEGIHLPLGELYERHPRELNFDLTRAALLRAVYSPWQLYEVMVGFWTDHFNIDSSKADCRWLKAWDDREVIRKHALGNFADLLRASALSPAMLFYLDGRQNRRRNPQEKPNENYARELMELHTLGVHGGYSQDDVMEVARCLTGWTVLGRDNAKWGIGRVQFIARNHDDGPKTVLGQQIPAGLQEKDFEEVLRLVTRHPATAKFIAEKLCRRFIVDDPPESAVTTVAEAFRKSGGEVKPTLRALFQTQEFREAHGAKFKRPFHFLVSALRAVGADSKCGLQIQQYLRRMGHMPFDYPTPEGYSDHGPDWHSTLLARWDFALRLTRGEVADSTVRLPELTTAAGGSDGLARHVLGRRPTAEEQAILQSSGSDQAALLLTSPIFQKY